MSFKSFKPVCYSEIKHIACTNTDFVLGLRYRASDYAKSAPTLPSARRKGKGKKLSNNAWGDNGPENEEEARKQLEKTQQMALEKQKIHLTEQTTRLHKELQKTTARVTMAKHDLNQVGEQKEKLQNDVRSARAKKKKLASSLRSHKSAEEQLEEEIKLVSEKIAKMDVAAEKIRQMGTSMSGTVKINLRRDRFPTKEGIQARQELDWFETHLVDAKNRQKTDPTNHVQLF